MKFGNELYNIGSSFNFYKLYEYFIYEDALEIKVGPFSVYLFQ